MDLQPLIWGICINLSGGSAATYLFQIKIKLTQPSLEELGLGLSLAILICQFQNEFLASPFLLLENSNKFWPCSPSSSLEKFLSFPNFYIINVD